MKNQYFGDINDYKKYGLLRAILSVTNWEMLIAWMLTLDDDSSDGKFIEYLEQPKKWRQYDRDLYDQLLVLMKASERSVALIENTNLLYQSKYFSEIVPDDSIQRKNWFLKLLEASENSELVFLDPDNGLEIKSKKYGNKNSSKFLYWSEVAELWNNGKSVLIYQHFIRENRKTYTERMLKSLGENTVGSSLEAFSTSNVVFLLALQPKHHNHLSKIVQSVNENWKDQITAYSTIVSSV